MNIFVLASDHNQAARYYVDRHIVKIPLEICQVLCNAHHATNSKYAPPYRPAQINNPVCKWARASVSNYLWAIEHGLALCKEYTHRYGKIHKCQGILTWLSVRIPELPNEGLTPFYLAMPDDCKEECPIKSYRNYYNRHKRHLHNWKNRRRPRWIEK